MGEKIESARALFLHHLKTMLWVERKLSDEVLPELRDKVHAPGLREAVERHLGETKGHVRTVEHVFELVDAKPEAEESEALKGLRREHDEGTKMLSEDDEALTDLFHAGSIAKSEHLEIAAYRELIEMAEQLREEDVAAALRESLEQEESALHAAEAAMRKLLAEEIRV